MSIPVPEVRNLRFEVSRVPRDWHGGRRAVSSFFDNLSLFFPAGERFFVASVRAHRRVVKGERLEREVEAFCAQEGFHGREHVRYNRRLRAHGYPVDEMEARVERLLAFVARTTPRRWRLAITCALEHFTAVMAHVLLSDPRTIDGAHPELAALWRWHAVEENEHKAVAFDVYRAAGGHYLERVLVMAVVSVVFWAKVAEHQVRLMRAAGTLGSAREWRDLAGFLLVRPGALRRTLRLYGAYFRPGFHPWHLDNRALLDAWKAQLAQQSVSEMNRPTDG